jgi:Arc/MetJ family transcription regulator
MRPEETAILEAIDATLAGESVDPEYAGMAELALLLRAERPDPPPDFATRLDARVARRFASATPKRRAPSRWLFAPAAGLAVAAVVAIVVVTSGGGSHEAATTAAQPSAAAPRRAAEGSPKATADSTSSQVLSLSQAAAPALRGRKQIRSSQLTLSASGNRIDDVAQEVFEVIGADHGYVNTSTVTASGGPGAYAQFQLTVPSGALSRAMTQLSQLQYAHVMSRTDTSNDVTNQFNSASSRLLQARALRTSLLKQLENASTETQVDAIRARLADVNATISRSEAALRSLNHRVSYSQISLTVQAHSVPLSHKSHGFTLGRATHDAGHVLQVAAGVGLIALAVLVPFSLVAALVWWIAATLRRRRREQALDLA